MSPEPLPPPEPSPEPACSRCAAWWWLALLLLAGGSYLYGLDGQHVPRIGDEMPYAQVTRLTAASGRLLPLQASDPVLENTKPPLLFWLGIATTEGGTHWTLWRLRFPIVLVTFACALLVFLLGRRLAGTGTGLLGAVVFLGFFSTFRYGRPFLTNLPETLFVFAPYALAVAKPERMDRWPFWILATLALGLACWVKSFALVAPVGLAYAWWLVSRRGWRWGEFFRRDTAKLALLGLGGLALFAIWPLVDPHGGAVLAQFVGRENLGKIGSDGSYFGELFSGSHSVWRTWFGHVVNAGLYAPLLVVLAFRAWRGRARLTDAEKGLWILVLAFLVAYTFPAHRQENYLLPTVPALAVLLALRWQAFGKHVWRLSSVVTLVAGLVACAFLVLVVVKARYVEWTEYFAWDVVVPALVVLVSLWGLFRWRRAAFLFPCAVLLAHLSIACVTHPFERYAGHWAPNVDETMHSTVYVPSNFRATEEAYRFLWPHANPVPYPDGESPWLDRATGQVHTHRAVVRAPAGWTEPPGTETYERAQGQPPIPPHPTVDVVGWGWRFTLVTRLGTEDLKALLLEGRIERLVRAEVLAVPRVATPWTPPK